MVNNVCAKTQPQQQKMISKATKSKQSLQQIAMTQANLKYVMGQPMLTADQLYGAG
jgi:hypothetical protein